MNAQKFNDIVKARANERMQTKIPSFRIESTALITKYFGIYVDPNDSYYSDRVTAIFSILASTNVRAGWPAELWREEEKKVSDELLSIMDEMQKALISAGRLPAEDENTPKEEGIKP